MKKIKRKDKNEKRRLVMQKQNARREKNVMMYGAESGTTVVMGKTAGLNRRVLAVLLAIVFVLTSLVVGVNIATKAEDQDGGFNMLENSESNMVMRKGLKLNDKGTDDTSDDTYELQLEAYATAPFASKSYDSDTPLDVVLVMDQSSTMDTPDVWTGNYNTSESASESGKYSLAEAADGNHYYKVGDQYYLVQSDIHGFAEVQENGSVKTSWTAAQANTIYNTLSSAGRNLYYLNASSYEDVYVNSNALPRYSSGSNSITVRNLDREWWGPHQYSTNYYVYVPHDSSSVDGNHSCWHRVYYSEEGVDIFGGVTGRTLAGNSRGGYYFTFYYYTNSLEGSGASFTSGDANKGPGDTCGSGSSEVTLLSNFEGYAYITVGSNSGFGTVFSNSEQNNTTDNKLYTANGSYTHNQLYTESGIILACQAPNSTGSHTYTGSLYTDGYQLYYQTDPDDPSTKHYIGNSVFKDADEAYEVTSEDTQLYVKDTIKRLDAEKFGASDLAQQIAGAVSEKTDHRIAVVGFNNTGTVKSDLVAANENDSDPDNNLNDAIDTAISSLSASGTSSVSAGLAKAGEVFQANALGGKADSRKRIAILFTDDDAVETAAYHAAETLKDTYHASVYTIGYNKDGVSTTVEDWLDHLSSNYYGSTRTDDGIDYSATSTNKTTILSAFDGIATAMKTQTLTTTATLGSANAILRDVISKDFIAQNLDIKAYTVAADSVDSETGVPEWSSTKTEITLDSNNHSETPNANGTTTIDVWGFDYSSNYVSSDRTDDSYGQKLLVTISGLKLKDNVDTDSDRRIYSNTKDSGIYKKGAENLLLGTFPRPYVDKVSNLVPNGTSGIPGTSNKDVVVNKYLTANENGNYDLTLEAYSTAKNDNSTITEKIPTDFVVVVDQSASMSEEDMPTGQATRRDNVNLETVATGAYTDAYYYHDEATDNYYKVYGVKDYLYRYYPANYWFTGSIVDHFGTRIGWFMRETDTTTDINNAFYFRELVDGKAYYQPISSTIVGKIGAYMMKFKYTSVTGNEVTFNRENTTYSSNGKSPWYKNVLNGNVMNSGTLWSAANAAVQLVYPHDDEYSYSTLNLGLIQPKTGMYVNYPMYERHVAYTKLCYRDVNGVEHVLPSNQNNGQSTWEYCDDDGLARSEQEADSARPTYSNLYTFDTTQRRIEALQAALTEFALAVANETDSYGHVDNKVSIVGFSGGGESTYKNTELLTGETFDIQKGDRFPSYSNGYSADGYNYNGIMKSAATDADYAGALVDSTNGTVGKVNTKITAAINAITAYGGTQPEDGLDMANSVLGNRSNTTYTIRSGDKIGNTVDRNTVVIFFTDGQPGDYHTDDQYKEANDVVEAAKRIKNNGTSIFSIGVFGESDGNPLTYTSETTRDKDETLPWEYLGGWMETYQSGSTYYCLRRQWRPGNSDYTETANDTIYDYMSVTSSNYPDASDFIAPTWLSGSFSGNYIAATDGQAVRSKDTAEKTNKYYRMASSQETLVEAFLQAITMNNQPMESDGTLGPSTILRDILKEGTFEMTGTTNYIVETAKGKADSNGIVTFDNNRTAITLSPPPSLGSDEIEVTGFDYAVNSIYYGKPEDEDNDLAANQGRKLIVTLTNVVPKQTVTSGSNDPLLYSNEDASGLEKNHVPVATFPKPAITRHSYTLDVGDDNKHAQFTVTTSLVAGEGASDDLSDVILVKPDGTRTPYNEVADVTFTMADGQTFYFENVPQGYSVKTSTMAPDSFYTYSFWANEETNKDTLSVKDATSRTLDYSDNVLHVTSVSSYRTVTIAESVSGDYANTDDLFSVKLTLTPPNGDPYEEDTITLASDVILEKKSGGKYEATVSDLPGDQNEKELRIPAGWTLQVEPIAHERYDVEEGYPKYNTQVGGAQEELPISGVVIQSDLTNIFINNVAKNISVEGILNSSNHNWIIYILLAVGIIGAGVGGYFLWKKKDEFNEQ